DYRPHGRARGADAQVYGSWESSAVVRGDLWAKTSRFMNRATSATMRAPQGRGGRAFGRGGPEGGEVFAGHDGQVYLNQGGSWRRAEAGTQPPADQDALSSAIRDQLDHDLAARRDGKERMSRSSGG